MIGLVIGASSESIHAILQAKELGFHVIAFDGDSKAEGLLYADESYVVDIKDTDRIYRILDETGIAACNTVVIPVPIGRYLITTGSVNERYRLIGPWRKTTEICTDKWLFHRTMAEAGLRNVHCELLQAEELNCEHKELPLIVKPRYGAGSRSVIAISSESEWEGFIDSQPFNEDYVIEGCVDGEEYGIDGMVIGGRFYLVLVRKKLNTPMPYRQCVGYISVTETYNKGLYDLFSDYMSKVVSKADVINGIIHADIIYDGSKAFVIEMSARPSGHRLHDVFTPLVTGVDMVREYLSYVKTGEFNYSSMNNSNSVFIIRYFDIEKEIKVVPSEEYIMEKYPIVRYQCNLVKGEIKRIIDGCSLMSRGFFILESQTEENVCELANDLLNEYV